MGMQQKKRRFLTHLSSKGATLHKASHQVGAKIAYIPPEAVAIEVLFGGVGAPVVASAAVCIGASQPPERLHVELSGVITLVAVPSVLTSEAVPPSETSGVYTKLTEELTAA